MKKKNDSLSLSTVDTAKQRFLLSKGTKKPAVLWPLSTTEGTELNKRLAYFNADSET